MQRRFMADKENRVFSTRNLILHFQVTSLKPFFRLNSSLQLDQFSPKNVQTPYALEEDSTKTVY